MSHDMFIPETDRPALQAHMQTARQLVEWDGETPVFEWPGWYQQAACQGMGHHLFFPPKGHRSHRAQQICARCPVRQQCDAQAELFGEEHGVWGGRPREPRR